MGRLETVNGKPSRAGSWMPGEDEALAHWQSILGNRWAAVAKNIPGRTGQQCAQRWRHRVNPAIKRDKWTEAEDARLCALMKRHGMCWAAISRGLKGRTDQQCMGRWRRHLDPQINRCAWCETEDAELIAQVKLLGSQWSLIASAITGRTAQQCRARYFQLESSNGAPKSGSVACARSSGRATKRRRVIYTSDPDSEPSDVSEAEGSESPGSSSAPKPGVSASQGGPWVPGSQAQVSGHVTNGPVGSSRSSATVATLAMRRQSLISVKSRPAYQEADEQLDETDEEQDVVAMHGTSTHHSSASKQLPRGQQQMEDRMRACSKSPPGSSATCASPSRHQLKHETPGQDRCSHLVHSTPCLGTKPQAANLKEEPSRADLERHAVAADSAARSGHAISYTSAEATCTTICRLSPTLEETCQDSPSLLPHANPASCCWQPDTRDQHLTIDMLRTPRKLLRAPGVPATCQPGSRGSRLDTLAAAASTHTPDDHLKDCSASKVDRRPRNAIQGRQTHDISSRQQKQVHCTPAPDAAVGARHESGTRHSRGTSEAANLRPWSGTVSSKEAPWSGSGGGGTLRTLCSPDVNTVLSLLASPPPLFGSGSRDALQSPFDTRMFASPEQHQSIDRGCCNLGRRRGIREDCRTGITPSRLPVARSLLPQLGAVPDFVDDLLVTPAKTKHEPSRESTPAAEGKASTTAAAEHMDLTLAIAHPATSPVTEHPIKDAVAKATDSILSTQHPITSTRAEDATLGAAATQNSCTRSRPPSPETLRCTSIAISSPKPQPSLPLLPLSPSSPAHLNRQHEQAAILTLAGRQYALVPPSLLVPLDRGHSMAFHDVNADKAGVSPHYGLLPPRPVLQNRFAISAAEGSHNPAQTAQARLAALLQGT